MMRWLKNLIQHGPCLWLGHKALREYGQGEVFLRCTRCLARTQGWTVTGRPRPRFEGDPDRHRLLVPITRQQIVVVDLDTAILAQALHAAGRAADVNLLLMPAKSVTIQ